MLSLQQKESPVYYAHLANMISCEVEAYIPRVEITMKKPYHMGIFHAIDYGMNDVGHVVYKAANASKLIVIRLEVLRRWPGP